MQIKIERICVPTDFSDPAEHAIDYGAALAEQFGAELHLLHVIRDFEDVPLHPDLTAPGDTIREYFEQLEFDAAQQAERELPASQSPEEKMAQEFLRTLASDVEQQFPESARKQWWKKLNVVRVVRYGNPAEVIRQYALRHAIDLLVMGTHGRTGLKHFLIGSVAERVIRRSPCPVLAVREQEREFVRDA